MADNLKRYPAPWEGQLILACRKCQKKLKDHSDLQALAKLKKTIKRYNKQHPNEQLHVMNVPCLDLCPKDGVAVCNPAQLPTSLSILRSKEGVGALFSKNLNSV